MTYLGPLERPDVQCAESESSCCFVAKLGPKPSPLKVKVASASEASMPSYINTRCRYPEDQSVGLVLFLGHLLATLPTNFCYFFIFEFKATVGIKPETLEY